MIFEAFQYLTTPAPKHLKQMGYVREAIAIEARYKRCANSWKPHLQKCKDNILRVANQLQDGSHIMILGSGALFDVPLKELLKMTHKITCVDIVKNQKVQNNFPSVTFLEKDITGITHEFFNAVSSGESYNGPVAFRWNIADPPDLIISLNLLSQLPVNLIQFARKQGIQSTESFSDNVMSAHLNWLKTLESNILLIADVDRSYLVDGKLVRSEQAFPKADYLDFQNSDDNWAWNIAPKGEIDNNTEIVHKVGCWNWNN